MDSISTGKVPIDPDIMAPSCDDAPTLDPGDFKSIKIGVNLTNTLTKTQLIDGKRFYDSKIDNTTEDQTVEFIEFLHEGLVLEVPRRICAKGHILEITLTTHVIEGDVIFQTTAKVSSHSRREHERDTIRLEFTKFDRPAWKAFLAVFSKRQDEIQNFFRVVKGH